MYMLKRILQPQTSYFLQNLPLRAGLLPVLTQKKRRSEQNRRRTDIIVKLRIYSTRIAFPKVTSKMRSAGASSAWSESQF